jgi:hypothetical protein
LEHDIVFVLEVPVDSARAVLYLIGYAPHGDAFIALLYKHIHGRIEYTLPHLARIPLFSFFNAH